MKIYLPSDEELESNMKHIWENVPKNLSFYLVEGVPCFLLQDEDIIYNRDESVTWEIKEIGFNMHSFIQLITGEKEKKRIYLPLCLVNPQSRRCLEYLIQTTIDPMDGRLGSKDAEFIIGAKKGGFFKVSVKLTNLVLWYHTLKLMPFIPHRFRSKQCSFCRDLEREAEK